MNWEIITSISTAISTLIIVASAIFAIVQIQEARRTRRLEILLSLFKDLSSTDAQKNRQHIYARLPTDPNKLSPDDLLIIDQVLSTMESVWILIHEKQIEKDFVLETYGVKFLRLWKVLHPIVEFERERKGQFYSRRAEALVELSREYLMKHKMPLDYIIYEYPKTSQRHTRKQKK
jgi:hypothetical protein